MSTESIRFPGTQGHALAARLDSPPEPPRAYALFAHCFTCSKDSKAAAYVAQALAASGIATLRFDFTGLGASEGEFANSTFSSNVADLVRAADHLRETRSAPALLRYGLVSLAIGATWLDQALVSGPSLPRTTWGEELRAALAQRESFLVNHGYARREGPNVVLPRNLLSNLRQAELSATGKSLEANSRKLYRPAQDGVRVSGTYRQSLQLVSGRYALVEDGTGFSLVPWKPVIEKRLGQQASAVVRAGGVSWEIGRTRSLAI